MLVVEPLKEEDIPAVYEIEKLCFASPKGESVFRDDQNKYLIAKQEGKVIGYIGIEKIANEVHIINTAVHPEYRRRGTARRLLEEVLNDEDIFFLEVRVSNLPAQKLYHKYGFEKVGIRKNYYADNGEDAYLMRKNLK